MSFHLRSDLLACCLAIAALSFGGRAEAEWTPDTILAENAIMRFGNNAHAIAVDPMGDVHVVYVRDLATNPRIVYQGLIDGAWQDPVSLALSSLNPIIAVGGDGVVHVVWIHIDDLIWQMEHRMRGPYGWTDATVVADACWPDVPGIAAGLTKIHVTWENICTFDSTRVLYRALGTEGWEPEVGLGLRQEWSSVAEDSDGTVHVVSDNLASDLYHTACVAGIWTEPAYVSHGTCASVATSGHTLHVAFMDNGVCYRSYNGVSWSPTECLNPGGYSPTLAAEPNGTVHIVYGAGSAAYYQKQDASGWTEPFLLNLQGVSQGYPPSVAIDVGGRVHVLMVDNLSRLLYRRWDPETTSIPEHPDRRQALSIRVLDGPVHAQSVQFDVLGALGNILHVSAIGPRGNILWSTSRPTCQASVASRMSWDLLDSCGRRVPPGMYFILVSTETATACAKVVVLR
jgi:hypothetical protein